LTSRLGISRSLPVGPGASSLSLSANWDEEVEENKIPRLPEMQMGDCGWVLGLMAIF